MKVTKIKNIVIWALALINIFFLTFVLSGIYSERGTKNEALNDLGTLFASSGITLSIQDIHEGKSLLTYSVSRNPEAEKAMADALLGPTTRTDEGGNIVDYTGKKGTAEFRSGGIFEMTFKPGSWLADADALSASESLLKLMKKETSSVSVSGGQGNELVSAVCSLNGQPVFNCSIVFTFTDGQLAKIDGKAFADAAPGADRADMSSAATALMSFLSDVKSGKRVCTAINAVTPGYYLMDASGSLIPAWRIETDRGINYLNAVTGKFIGA